MKIICLSLLMLLQIFTVNVSFAFPVYIPENDIISLDNQSIEEVDPQNISVFSWNIYKGKNRGFKQEFLHYMNLPGIHLVQEYYSGNKINSYLADLNQKHIVLGLSYGINLWGETGVATISTATQHNLRNLRTKAHEDFTFATYKTSLFSWFKLKDQKDMLLVVNTHLLVSVDKKIYEAELKRIEKLIESHQGPLVVAGDFNDWPEKKISIKNWASRNSLKRVAFSPDHRKSFDGNRIDHIFYRGLVLKASWSVETNSSDHNPFAALFSI